uniref:calcium uptake protein 3, mitochondrial-like n=1 Tax=Myxine glutinosa TaxID=7769 RepID=UPI00358E5A37
MIRLARRVVRFGIQVHGRTRWISSWSPRGTRTRIEGKQILTGLVGLGAATVAVIHTVRTADEDTGATSCSDNDPGDNKTISFTVTSSLERCFVAFCSLEFAGQVYMTPLDFLQSLTSEKPRMKERKILSTREVKALLASTPPLKSASSNLFQSLGNRGLLSYSDYLFLLCILAKPQHGFKIAFKMFDTDGNEQVDKAEFIKLQQIFRKSREDRKSNFQSNEDVDTTLTVHLFGGKGQQYLTYSSFQCFVQAVQREVASLEFNHTARGLPYLNGGDFVRTILKHTSLSPKAESLAWKADHIEEIYLDEFCQFFVFLNHLDDFETAVHMYTRNSIPIGKDEFSRVVVVLTGQPLPSSIVSAIFAAFDPESHGCLRLHDFVSTMRQRLSRGHKDKGHPDNLAFFPCVKRELSKY